MALLNVLEDSPTQWTITKEEGLKDALQDGVTDINIGGLQIAGSAVVPIQNVVEDTSPQLGGALDAQTNNITGVGKLDYSFAAGGVSALGNLGATEAIDWSTATTFTGTLDSDLTVTHTNELSGQKITLFLSYDGTAQRTVTWSDVDTWIDGVDGTAPTTPSASGQVLVVTMIFVGTTCYASATGNYSVN